MDKKAIKLHLDMMKSACIRAEDSMDKGDSNDVEWCMAYLEKRIEKLRAQMDYYKQEAGRAKRKR